MDLKDVASVAGKGGLFKVVKPTRSGVILEALDGSNKKLVANANSRVSILKEISIYTTTAEGTILLEDVFKIIHQKHKTKLPVSTKNSNAELLSFLKEIVPEYDEEKVYASDAKKVVNWYNLLLNNYPEQFDFKEEEPAEEEVKVQE